MPDLSGFFVSGEKMSLEKRIATALKEESDKLILRYHEYHNNVHSEYLRNEIRLGNSVPNKVIRVPDYWAND